MKLLSQLPNEKAQKELRQFAILGLVLSAIALFIFGFLGIAGLAFSARALVLISHKGNRDNPKLRQYRAMAIAGVIIGVIDLAWVASH